MKIMLVRAGQFKANWKSFDGVCGHAGETPQKYNYRCEIDADQHALDENGFIIDQLEVDKYFQTQFKHPSDGLSCERIAMHSVHGIKNIIPNTRFLLRVRVSIGVIPPPGVVGEAMISAEWTQ